MENLTWTSPEFIRHHKPASWFVSLWIIVAGLVVVSILTGSLFMAILVVVAGAVLSLFGAKEPRQVEFSLNQKKLSVDTKISPLESFSSFWIFETEEYAMLSLVLKGSLHPHLKILLPPEYVADVRLILRASVEEEEQEEAVMDAVADWLRF